MRRRPWNKQKTANNSLAAHLGGGQSRQGGAQQGKGARGEQDLDGFARSHTIAALELFARTLSSTVKTNKDSLNQVSVFSKRAQERAEAKEGGSALNY